MKNSKNSQENKVSPQKDKASSQGNNDGSEGNNDGSKENIVSYAISFEQSMAKLRGSRADKLFEQINKLRKDILSKGLNLKKLAGDFYSFRLTKGDRIILAKPKEGHYLLLWADRHDDAYDWAKKHTLYVDPVSGAISVISVQPQEKELFENPEIIPEYAKVKNGLFEEYSDEDLLNLGLPKALLPKLRSLTSEDELQITKDYFPSPIFEYLHALISGIPIEELIRQRGSNTAAKSLKEAIELPQKDVKVWENEALEDALGDDIQKWRIFLHPVQRAIVENPSKGPLMVKGAAGTGKTVVAMHRAAHLVKDPSWNPEKKLLFTTYTTNLALDIEQNLAKICTPEELQRIEVANIDRWVAEYLKKKGIKEPIEYPGKDPQTKKDSLYSKLWKTALKELPVTVKVTKPFVKAEWEDVILPNRIKIEKEYLKFDRKDRDIELSPKERKALWRVFGKMRELLAKSKVMTFEDACFLAVDLLKEDPSDRPYDAVIVDETQDLKAPPLRVLAELATLPSDNKSTKQGQKKNEPRIFLAGDGFQRIYLRNPTHLKECGIDVDGDRTTTLKVTYRTTDEIRKAAEKVLSGHDFLDSNDEVETLKGVVSNRSGELPVVKPFEDISDEVKWIDDQIRDLNMGPKHMEYPSICIVARHGGLLREYRDEFIKQFGYPENWFTVIGQTKKDIPERDGIRLATMHRVKGLEFKAVFIAGANKNVIPYSLPFKAEGEELNKENELRERSIFYVACSRARDNLFITSSKEEGEYMKTLDKYLKKLNSQLEKKLQ